MNRDDLLNYLSFIISSAKGCLKEPKIYGPFRLVESLDKLIKILEKNNILIDELVLNIAQKINYGKSSFMEDESAFIEMLDEITFDLINALRREE